MAATARKLQKSTSESPRPGRPRNTRTEERILRTALDQLSSEGYHRMSIDSVAAAAGVSKPTIYRRWSGKADLATAALATLRMAEPNVEAASPRQDLQTALGNFQSSLLRPHGMALIGTVLAEEDHTPELLALFRNRIVEPRRAILRQTLRRGQASGEIPEDADLEAAINLLIGSLYARYLSHGPAPRDWSARVVKLVWRGLARAGEPEAASGTPARPRRSG